MADCTDDLAMEVLRHLNWCPPDSDAQDQAIRCIKPLLARALRAARAEGIEAAWQAAYAAMSNETNASQQRVRKAIRALLTKESDDA